MKKTKQKEEECRNTNKVSDVRIMKKIIVEIYNNLQVLWSSKVKFVLLSQLLGCPLFWSNSGLFTVPGFIVSLVVIKKKKREGRRDIKGEKEGVEQERRKKRKKVLKERKNNKKIINNYFKKKKKQKPACWPSQFCWCFWLQLTQVA